MVNMSVSTLMLCCSVVKFEVWGGDTSAMLLFFRNFLAILGLLCVFTYKVGNCSFKIYEVLCWKFNGVSIVSADCFW